MFNYRIYHYRKCLFLIFKNLFETFNQLVASKIANVEKSLVEESFQMMNQDDEMHEKEAMIDIETAFQILTIYLNLRKIIYSNIKLN